MWTDQTHGNLREILAEVPFSIPAQVVWLDRGAIRQDTDVFIVRKFRFLIADVYKVEDWSDGDKD